MNDGGGAVGVPPGPWFGDGGGGGGPPGPGLNCPGNIESIKSLPKGLSLRLLSSGNMLASLL